MYPNANQYPGNQYNTSHFPSLLIGNGRSIQWVGFFWHILPLPSLPIRHFCCKSTHKELYHMSLPNTNALSWSSFFCVLPRYVKNWSHFDMSATLVSSLITQPTDSNPSNTCTMVGASSPSTFIIPVGPWPFFIMIMFCSEVSFRQGGIGFCGIFLDGGEHGWLVGDLKGCPWRLRCGDS